MKNILPTQIFVPYLDDNDRKRAQNSESLDEIWNVCGPKISALDFEKLCRKIFKAMKSKYNNDENHENVRKLKEVLEKYCKTFSSSTCAEEKAGDDHLEGNSTHPRKPIDQKPSQVREDGTTPELLQDTQEATTSEGTTTLDTNVTSKLLPPSKYYEVARQATTTKEKEELVKMESKPVLLQIDRGEYANGICVSRLCKPSNGEIVTGIIAGKINYSSTLNTHFIMPT